MERAIGEIIQIVDTESNKINYLVAKFGDNWKFVDHQARLIFYEAATVGVLKYTSGFNYHNKRH